MLNGPFAYAAIYYALFAFFIESVMYFQPSFGFRSV